jgi:hypothetical protein
MDCPKDLPDFLRSEVFEDFGGFPVGITFSNQLDVLLFCLVLAHSLDAVPGIPFCSGFELNCPRLASLHITLGGLFVVFVKTQLHFVANIGFWRPITNQIHGLLEFQVQIISHDGYYFNKETRRKKIEERNEAKQQQKKEEKEEKKNNWKIMLFGFHQWRMNFLENFKKSFDNWRIRNQIKSNVFSLLCFC